MEIRSDEELLHDHVAGDPEAFGELFSRHKDRLWAIALRTMRHREDAADALQDAMISAFRRAHTFRGASAVTTWLHRIVVNACLDKIRSNKVRRSEPIDDGEDFKMSLSAQTNEAEDTVTSLVVTDALANINADQRAALVLVDMQGYSVDDAAVILGCAPGTIKSRCARGRAKLAKVLREGGNPDDA